MGIHRSISVLLLVLWPSASRSAVDSDCFAGADSFICHQGRVEDAKLADQLAAPVLAKHGWSRGCFTVQFVKGDNGGPDTLMVSVNGPTGGTAPACTQIQAAKLTDAETREIYARGGRQQEMMAAIADKTAAKGKQESANDVQLRDIGQGIKQAIMSASPATKSRLLKHTRQVSLGSGYGAEATIPLP